MNLRLLSFVLLALAIIGCARRGRPEGGPRDLEKPIMVRAVPEFKSLHFEEKEIRIYFDEYIKLQNINSQLIVSPPLKYQPVISPLGTPSKRLTIKLNDTLQENTTYTFNFGQSILDNTEGNVLDNFKYIFSTGDYIDSLKIRGSIKDAFELEMTENPTIMLYPVHESYKDSVIYSEKPTYVGSTIDSVNWDITNIKAGTYRLIALNDASKNYKFNPKEDKIAFEEEFITIPGDSVFRLRLFREVLPFRLVSKPKEISRGHLIFGYEGDPDGVEFEVLSPTAEDFKSVFSRDKETDTLHFWMRNFSLDSIRMVVSKDLVKDTVDIRLGSEEMDSLQVTFSHRGVLHPNDTLRISANLPIVQADTTRFYFINQDSLRVPFRAVMSKNSDALDLLFEKQFQDKYTIRLFPGAITDIFGLQNDSLKVELRTGKIADYCSIFLTINNVDRYPVIVDLINEKGEIVAKKYVERSEELQFLHLEPSRFKVRLIYDDNMNGKWDTGNFLRKVQPEAVYYFRNVIDAKANWEVVESLNLEP